MDKKKRITKEIVRFICSCIAGVIISLFLYRILGVDIGAEVMVLGVIVTLIAVYIVRLTLWVFKSSM